MPTYDVVFYAIDPFGVFSQTVGGTATYTGPATAAGSATITDNGVGIDGLTLDDDNAGETATADVTLGGTTSFGNDVDAEESWTVRDTVTGDVFEIVSFQVEGGPNAGYYTLSEMPLVAGRVYETLNFDDLPDASAGDATFTYADVTGYADGIVEGTAGDDVIDTNYTGDPEGDVIDGNDAPGATPDPLSFNWRPFGDETDLRGGVSQDTGGIQVDVTYSDADTNEEFSVETGQTIYTAPGEPFDTTSAGYLYGTGSPANSLVTFDFSSVGGSGYNDEVENVQFRINDIDGLVSGGNNFQDIVTITAFDADGNPVPVNITVSGDDTLSGNTVTGGLVNDSPDIANGSILVEIPGPVAQIVVEYDNGGNTQQAIYLSDLHFDAVPIGSNDDLVQAGAGNDLVDAGLGADEVYGEAGDDTLTGGAGADTLDGGTGDDTLNVGSGDSALGGDGDDTFLIDTGALDGSAIFVSGGEGAETAGDTLDFNGQLLGGSLNITNSDDAAGGLSGTATLLDGSIVTFENIENIICFADGTLIETPRGPVPIEDLRVGDLVLTRDNGPQPIRWKGTRRIDAPRRLAPITFAPGSIGNRRELRVSPQHRLLIEDYRAQLHFGADEVLVAAKQLINGDTVIQDRPGPVTYHHLFTNRHEILMAEGAASESYHPGSHSLPGLDPKARAELFEVFPELRLDPILYGPTARPCVRGRLGTVLAA